MGDSSKFVPMAEAPTRMIPFKRQTSRAKGVYHAPPETLPSMVDKSKNPGCATDVGMWFTKQPPEGWDDGDAQLRAMRGRSTGGSSGNRARRQQQHAAKDAEIVRLHVELERLRARSSGGRSQQSGGSCAAGKAGQALFAGSIDMGGMDRDWYTGAGGRAGAAAGAGGMGAVERAVLRSRGSSRADSAPSAGSGGGFTFTTDAAHSIPRDGGVKPARGRPRTATLSAEVLWSEMPNSLHRSHAVEVVPPSARAALRTGARGMRRESRAERRGANAVSISYG